MSRYLSDHVHLGDDLTSVVILDQTLLPNEAAYLTLREPEEMFEAIQALRVRGAPAIGICAGYCLAALAEQRKDLPPDQFRAELHRLSAYLNSSRPTAVNLSWALNRLGRLAHTMPEAAPAAVAAALREEAIAIHKEDIAMCRAISEHGLTLIKDGDGILTHCNAGPLATSQYGTALGPLLLGTERGMNFRVFADETRPL
ncbi:MAG: S-methyl-5-thioribose-1-phosphate isomerase, partial [Oscillospiraceae bacterium]|nr:S-methyl-5-thioribose-1-phosphate isomerase [Oscillospiraceae bacterium]